MDKRQKDCGSAVIDLRSDNQNVRFAAFTLRYADQLYTSTIQNS